MVEYHFKSDVDEKYMVIIKEMIENHSFTTLIGDIEITIFQENFNMHEYG